MPKAPDPSREAAETLRRIVKLLRFPAPVASYLRGYADGLASRRRRSRR